MRPRISRRRGSKDLEPYEESATQRTEPAEETRQVMLHEMYTSAYDGLSHCQHVLTVSSLLAALGGQEHGDPRAKCQKMLRSTSRVCPERMSGLLPAGAG